MSYLHKKKLAFMSIVNNIKGFVRSVTGVLPLTLPDSVLGGLINYIIRGNSVQNGTPTPEAPVEVESVGEYDQETEKYKIPVICGNIKTNIYLDEPLRKVGSYADYIDFENQKVVRRVGSDYITTVDGTSSNLTTYRVYMSNLSKKPVVTQYNDTIVILSSKFKQSENASYGKLSNYPNSCLSYITTSEANRVVYTFADTSLRTVTQGQEALGDGFEVCYVLAEEEETPIALPKLPTTNIATVYTIGTKIQPSNMSATYYATSKE